MAYASGSDSVILSTRTTNTNTYFWCFVRLEAYDRNYNFASGQSLEQTDYSIKLPELSGYKDINAASEVCTARTGLAWGADTMPVKQTG